MNLIVGLLITTIFYYLTANLIKKYSVGFYIGFYVVIVLMVLLYSKGYYQELPEGGKFFADLFQRGVISTSTFIIVMYLGTVTKHNGFSRRLMQVRGEISIIGCLMALTHNILFGITYFVAFFKNPEFMNIQTKIATILTLILIALMRPLFITSFKGVRKKMNGKTWKNVQRLAYPFFFLIYVHVMVLFSLDVEKHKISIIAYTLVYVAYAVLRLRKYAMTKAKKKQALERAKS